MKIFVRRGGLAGLPRASRIVYTGYLLFAVLHLGSAAALYVDVTSQRAPSIATYYRGTPPTPVASDEKIQLPDDALAPPTRYALSFSHLLEVSHGHLYAMPISWLILSHLFLITGAARWLKATAIAGMFAGVVSHIALPWLIQYVSADFAPLFGPTGALLGLSSLTMIAGALYEMWVPRAASPGPTT